MVLTLTFSPCLDVEVSVPVVEPERKLRCTDERTHAGGGGLNVARVIARLGVPALAVFPAGGETGRRVIEHMSAEGVKCEVIATHLPTRENLTVKETSTGRQYRFLLPPPQLTSAESEALAASVRQHARDHRHVVISGSIPEGIEGQPLRQLIGEVKSAGAEVLIDTSGAALLDAFESGVLLVKPSRRELSVAVGRPLADEAAVEGAARELLARGDTRAVLVSLAADGALLVERSAPAVRLRAPEVELVSGVGAGDSMVGGVVVGLERGFALEEAARLGVACGSATVGRLGSFLCRPEDVDALVSQVTITRLAAPAL